MTSKLWRYDTPLYIDMKVFKNNNCKCTIRPSALIIMVTDCTVASELCQVQTEHEVG